MEAKPKAVKLVRFEEEPLSSGRKLLHCIFENRYGSSFQYKWTAPWRDKGSEHGAERLLLKCIEVEEWNDFDGVWSEELRKVAKEVPSLEEMVLPVKIKIGGVTEDFQIDKEGIHEYLKIYVDILTDKDNVTRDRDYGEEYIRVGSVRMAWESLTWEIFSLEGVVALSQGTENVIVPVSEDDIDYMEVVPGTVVLPSVEGVRFWVSVEKTADKGEYTIISRRIASCIRRFIRIRLSEYRQIRKGFEEQA